MARKVLWIGDAGCHTGFATVTHNIGERLVATYGHDVYVLATNYRGDYWDTNLRMYVPTMLDGGDYYGKSRILEMLAELPDVVVMLGDPQVLINLLFDNRYDTKRILLQLKPLIGYIPIDGHNLPPGWDVLAGVMTRVAMTKFGQQLMPEAPVVYHGIDADAFFPISADRPLTVSNGQVLASKREAKKAFGFDPDGFLVLRIDSNSGRKDYPASWKALVPVMRKYGDIQVHFHCTTGQTSDATNLRALLERDPETQERFFFPQLTSTYSGWPTDDLCGLYNAADVFLSTSRGEGFGLTLAEAAACGVPIIAQNISAIPEIVGPGAILLEPQREITVPSAEDQWLCDIGAFTEAIETLYLSAGRRRTLGKAGYQHVQQFSWDLAAENFHKYIEAAASRTDVDAAHGGNDG